MSISDLCPCESRGYLRTPAQKSLTHLPKVFLPPKKMKLVFTQTILFLVLLFCFARSVTVISKHGTDNESVGCHDFSITLRIR